MKRSIVVLLALFLALPAVSFAGSATSRWDLTIGGYVKFDMGYATQGQGQDIYLAQRSGAGAYGNVNDKYGNFYSYAGESRLNFLVRGPDAWGAKTTAFIEADFRGNQSGSGAGTFGLRHAFMQFEWPNSKLMIGQTWQTWGFLPTWSSSILDNNNISPFLKGMRQPLIRFEQTLAKAWTWKLGIISPTNTLGSNSANATSSGVVDSYTRSSMPFWEGSFGWTSDKCGKIGPWQLLFSLDGFYGRQKQIAGLNAATYTGNSTAYNVSFRDKDVDSWGMAFKGYIPIIPANKGNKKGAFSVSGAMYYTQNPGFFQSSSNTGSATMNGNYSYGNVYSTSGALILSSSQLQNLDYSAPVQYGGWGQMTYFITDKLYLNGWYGYTRTQASDAWRLAVYNVTTGAQGNPASGASLNGNAMINTTQIIANVLYDVNAAIRMGFEYEYMTTRYANYEYSGSTIVGSKDGSAQSFRVGAWYFF